LSYEELKNKFLNMVQPVLSAKQAEQIMQLAEDLENLVDVRPMLKALARK